MNLKTLSLAGLLAVSSTVMAAESAQPPYTVTINFQNNSSHTITGWIPHIFSQKGQCIFSNNSLVCQTNEKGELLDSGSFFYDGYALTTVPLTISSQSSASGNFYLGSMYPKPEINLAITNSNWDAKSNITTTVIFSDAQK